MVRGVLALVIALVLVPVALASHPLRTGLAIGPTEPSLTYQLVRDAGTTVARLTVDWSLVAPTTRPPNFQAGNPDDPAYNWSGVDSEVNLAVAHHLQPLLTVFKAPRWAEQGAGDKSSGGVGVNASAFAAFGKAIATRYDGAHGHSRVSYWEVWNEPNIDLYFSPQYSFGQLSAPAAYRTLLNAFAAAVHGVRRSDVVVAGALAPFTLKTRSTLSIGPLRWMRAFLCMSAGAQPKPTCHVRANFDVWSQHPYTSGGPTHKAFNKDDVSLGNLPEVKGLLDAAYRAGHIGSHGAPGFWVTEFSWDSSPPDPKGVPLALHGRWTAEALYRMWQAGVDVVIWLQLYDGPFPSTPAQAGLYFLPGANGRARAKPALTAFTFPFVAYLGRPGVSVWARTPWGRPATATIERRIGRAWLRIATVRTDRFGIAQATIRGTFTKKDWLRARVGAARSLPFSLTQPPDHFYNPFGS
ncbi:MAG: hypothetical protein ACYDCH_01710 [Gaiellaceae bacterium]